MKKTAPIPFAGSRFGEWRHVCAFFHNDDEAYRVLLPFIQDGFQCNHKAIHLINPGQVASHRERLRETGIDVAQAERNGQLELRINTEAYLAGGQFDPDRMLQTFEELAGSGSRGLFPLSRILCQMDWAAAENSCIDRLIEFESRVNDVWQRHEDAVICTYNLARFGGDTVIDIMRTHPMVIIGGLLQENPFYVPPKRFLREIRERRATSPAL